MFPLHIILPLFPCCRSCEEGGESLYSLGTDSDKAENFQIQSGVVTILVLPRLASLYSIASLPVRFGRTYTYVERMVALD